MKRRLFVMVLTVLTLLAAVSILPACDEDAETAHQHTYATEWSSDGTTHWHASTCGHSLVVADRGVHVWNGGVVTTAATCDTPGVRTYTCVGCGATKTDALAVTAHTFATEWSKDVNKHWHASTCGHAAVSGMAFHNYGSGDACVDCGWLRSDVIADSVEAFKTAINNADNGDIIALSAGIYDFDNETIEINKAVSIIGFGDKAAELRNVVFDVDATSPDREMNAVFNNLKFTGTSRIAVGNRTHHNGVGGPAALPITSLTVKNCYAKTEFSDDGLAAGKGQFVYLAATYTVKLDLTLTGNQFINAHTIENEDADPVVNGNGTVINSILIENNTFGDAENPCARYAVKFARRADGADVIIRNNVVYGATTEAKDFYILDLWQSGGNVQNDLSVTLSGNVINCTPDEGRSVYTAYIESSVKGSNLTITSDGSVLDKSVQQ